MTAVRRARPGGYRSIPPLPIDNIAERLAIEIGAEIFAEQINSGMSVLVAGGRDMRRDQDLRFGPQPRHWRALEFADIDVQGRTSQVIALERNGESTFVHDFATSDIDEHAPRPHRGKAVFVEETGCLRRPLAADHHEIAFWQEPVEIPPCLAVGGARGTRCSAVEGAV
jgi:hypothetical protein